MSMKNTFSYLLNHIPCLAEDHASVQTLGIALSLLRTLEESNVIKREDFLKQLSTTAQLLKQENPDFCNTLMTLHDQLEHEVNT